MIHRILKTGRQALGFPITIAALVCLLLDRMLAFDGLGAIGNIVLALVRAFLGPYGFVHYRLYRASIGIWADAAPAWWDWLSIAAALLPYAFADILLRGTRSDRTAAATPPMP